MLAVALSWGVPSAVAEDPQRTGDTPPGAYRADPSNSHVTNTEVIDSLGLAPGAVASLSFGASDHNGFDVFRAAASGFPTQGASYFVMSSGCTSLALTPNITSGSTCVLANLNTSQRNDLVQVTLVLNVPAGAQSWIVDWKFLSEEFPEESVGSFFNDAFLIEVGASNITINGNTITAPNNVAFDANNSVVTIGATGALAMTAANALGTTYDGATTRFATLAPVPSGATTLTLIFSVFDMGDSIIDSAAFIDNIRFSSAPIGQPTTIPVGDTTFLVIDEDSIDDRTSTIQAISSSPTFCGGPASGPGRSARCVNDQLANPGVRGLLFTRGTATAAPFSGAVITPLKLGLPTGKVGDEGLFTLPPSLVSAQNGVVTTRQQFINNLGPAKSKNNLEKVNGVAPLRTPEISALIGKTVCAVVYDRDISVTGANQARLNGATLGITAFRVTAVLPPPAAVHEAADHDDGDEDDGDDRDDDDEKASRRLPVIEIELLSSAVANVVCTQ